MKHFPIELWCAMKSEFYTTASNNQLSGWTEKKLQSTSQSQTCTKKGHGHCSMICYKSDPLQLSESLQNHYIWESMLSKLMRCPENCNTCSQHWSTEWAQFSMTTPDCISYNQCFKSWMSWATKFCLICHILFTSGQLTMTSSSILTIFAGKTLPHPAVGRKCFPRVCQIPKHEFLCYRNRQIYVSFAKMCWL